MAECRALGQGCPDACPAARTAWTVAGWAVPRREGDGAGAGAGMGKGEMSGSRNQFWQEEVYEPMYVPREIVSSSAFAAIRTAAAHLVLMAFYSKRQMERKRQPVIVRRSGDASTTERSRSRTKRPLTGTDSPPADSEMPWMSLSGLASSTSRTAATACTRTRRYMRSVVDGNGMGLRSSCQRSGQSGRRGWDSRKGISMARTRVSRIHSCCAQQLTTVAGYSWGEIEPAFSSQRTRVAGMPSTVVHNSALKTPPRGCAAVGKRGAV